LNQHLWWVHRLFGHHITVNRETKASSERINVNHSQKKASVVDDGRRPQSSTFEHLERRPRQDLGVETPRFFSEGFDGAGLTFGC
jgi:hypothetical protein